MRPMPLRSARPNSRAATSGHRKLPAKIRSPERLLETAQQGPTWVAELLAQPLRARGRQAVPPRCNPRRLILWSARVRRESRCPGNKCEVRAKRTEPKPRIEDV